MSPTQETGASHNEEEGMTRTYFAMLALAGVAACGGGERRDLATADSLSRDLQLAPVDTTAELNDQPASEPEPAPAAEPRAAPAPAPRPTPRPAAPKPAPAPAAEPAPAPAPAAASLAAGTSITATTDAEIRS